MEISIDIYYSCLMTDADQGAGHHSVFFNRHQLSSVCRGMIMTTADAEIALYQTEDGATFLTVHLEKETVWLTQNQMSELFGKDVRTVNEHIKNIFREGELLEQAVIRN